MGDGKITQSGSYEELLTAGTAFEQLVSAHRDAMTVLNPSGDTSQREFGKVDTVQPEESKKQRGGDCCKGCTRRTTNRRRGKGDW
jgi:hypothetical protein